MSQSVLDQRAEQRVKEGNPLAHDLQKQREWARRAHPSAELNSVPVRCFTCPSILVGLIG
jgi:hypothetical protein